MIMNFRKIYTSIYIILGLTIGVFLPFLLLGFPEFYYVNSIAIIIFLISLFIQNKYNKLTNFINIISFFNIFILFFIFIGFVCSVLYKDIIQISSVTVYYLSFCYLFFTIGVVIGELIINKRAKEPYEIHLESDWILKRSIIISRCLFIIGILLGVYYFKSVGAIPLLVENSDAFRVKAKEGRSALYLLIFSTIFIATLVRGVCVTKFRISMLIDAILFCVAFLILLGIGYRGQAFNLILLLFLIYVAKSQKKIKLIYPIIFSTIIFYFLAVVGYYRSSGSLDIDYIGVLKVTIWRFFVNIYNLEHLVRGIGHNFMLGYTYLIDLSTLLPGYQPSTQIYLKDKLGLVFEGGGITYTLFGELLINWGYIGGVIFSAMFGLFLTRLKVLVGVCYNDMSYSKFGYNIILIFSLTSMVGSGVLAPTINVMIPLTMVYFITLNFVKVKQNVQKETQSSHYIRRGSNNSKDIFNTT